MGTLLDPNGVSWRVHREAVLLLGGRRALLMQIAHPLVAAAVADHSHFKEDPFGRLRRTVNTMFTLSFGSAEEAKSAYRQVDAVHAGIRGRLNEAAGGLSAGMPYQARDPELLFWVHATLVDTAMRVYSRYVCPLSAGEEEQFYQESKTVARLFKIPDSSMPADVGEFRRYMARMIDGGPVRVSATARELAGGILYPPVPLVPSAAFAAINVVTIGLLPPPLREQFGLAWNPARQILSGATSAAIRRALPLLPDFLRAVPAARAAERSVSRN